MEELIRAVTPELYWRREVMAESGDSLHEDPFRVDELQKSTRQTYHQAAAQVFESGEIRKATATDEIWKRTSIWPADAA